MNYAKKLGQKMVKARASGGQPAPAGLRADFRAAKRSPGGVVRPGGGYHGPWRQVGSQGGGPAAPGSSMGFGKGYKQTYAESHKHGKPTTALRNYRKRKRVPKVTTTPTSA